jgi:uncharacterized protein (TIGR02453 family)
MISFIGSLVAEIKTFEPIVEKDAKKYVGRIYRDLRFSKDKTPYHSYFNALIERGGDGKKCPLYLHLEPDNCFLGGGIWQPEPDLLKRVRQEIDYNGSVLHEIIENKKFIKYFQELTGDKLLRVPKGYEPDNPNLELLKLKQYIVHRRFDEHLVVSSVFLTEILLTYDTAIPFFTFFDQVKLS